MHRARRLASIVVISALAIGGLTACRSDPSVAVYVGSVEYTDSWVVRTADELIATLPQEQRAGYPVNEVRRDVVHLTVVRDVLRRYAQAKKITVAEGDIASFAQQRNMDPKSAFTKLAYGYGAVATAVGSRQQPAAPTAADQREAYDNATVQGQPLSAAAPFDQVQRFFDQQTLGPVLGLRQALTEALRDVDVSINPQYAATFRLPVQVQNANSWFSVDLAGRPPVRDVSDKG